MPRAASIDDYIALQPRNVQAILRKVRAAIRKGLPKADEAISYQIPSYKVNGRAVLYFAAWKEHFSLYPATGGLVEAFGRELERYKVSKGTIRFPLDERVPVTLIQRIARFRAREAAARAKDR
jgi:uncharacterized protein YdhG (YjbR/CyaY superfamily)